MTAASDRRWFVYMLECSGDRIYTGISPDVNARYRLHCSGRGAAFTRINPPRRILAAMPCDSRSSATRHEIGLKKLPRARKLQWAAQWAWHETVV
jgi:putative endonuclease